MRPLQTVFSALAVEATEACTVPEEIIGRSGGSNGNIDLEAICRDTSAEAFQRLLFDVFGSDVRAFRCRTLIFPSVLYFVHIHTVSTLPCPKFPALCRVQEPPSPRAHRSFPSPLEPLAAMTALFILSALFICSTLHS